jgi:hypothetical protein
VQLPLTKVVLFNAGIGYFHREGTIEGNARVNVKVNEEDVNDLILTLLTNDPKGTTGAVTYDNKAPADITLKAFSIDLTENPGVGSLLQQVRGEKIEITDQSGSQLVGNIVSVERPAATVVPSEPNPFMPDEGVRVKAAKPVVLPPPAGAIEQVSLLTDDGLQTVPLAKVKKVKFTKPELQQEFRKALEALAAARGASTKSVGVTFTGQGSRKVSIGYVADAPLWKPTYRVVLGPNGPRLVGLAAVENTTDEDWENVQVKLVSGRPMTFKMDLYDPLFVPRPTIEPELYASLRPPLYQGAVQQGQGFAGGAGLAQLGGGQLGGNLGVGGGFAGQFGMQGGSFMYGRPTSGVTRASVRSLLNPRLDYQSFEERRKQPGEGVPMPMHPATSASANLGESFEYIVKQPVTLPRFKSALLPVIDELVEATAVSIFNPGVLESYPLKGLRLTNKTSLFVAQGPVTVFEGDVAAGQARLPDVKPGESRLLSYAIDLDLPVKLESPSEIITPVSVRISGGQLRTESRITRTSRYSAFNKSRVEKTLWLTQERQPGWNLISPAKPAELTAQLQRFELKVKPGEKATLDVIEETDRVESQELGKMSEAQLKYHQSRANTPAAAKVALGRLLTAIQAQAETASKLAEEQAALKEIAEDQTRIRANIERVPKDSDAFKRYLKKFDDQETEIEKRQAEVKKLTKLKDQQAKEFGEMLRTMNAE